MEAGHRADNKKERSNRGKNNSSTPARITQQKTVVKRSYFNLLREVTMDITTTSGWEQASLLRPDPKAAQDFLQWLGDYVLFCIHRDTGVTKAFRGLLALNNAFSRNAEGYNVYYVVNKVASGLIKKPSKNEIEIIRAVDGDIDWDRDKFKGHFPQGLAELQITVELLKSVEPPPTIIVHTGGGLQPLWRIEELANTPENMQRAEALGRYIGRRFNGDSVQNIDRVLRLPGTVNHPKKDKRDAGQTTGVAAVVYDSGNVYTLEQLEAAWPISAAPTRVPKSSSAIAPTPAGPPLEESSLAADMPFDDFGGGLDEIEIQELEYYGLIVASVLNGPFSSRKKWLNATGGELTDFNWLDWLFAASDLADEYPQREPDIKQVFNQVCDRAGGDTSGNDKQWKLAIGQSTERRAAGKSVTTIGTLIRLAGIVEPLIPVTPTEAGPGAATNNSQPPEPPDEGENERTPDANTWPKPDAAGPSKVLTPYRRFGDPRPALSIRTIVDVVKNPPPRPWALGRIALYGAATTISSPGGYGKTALAIVLLLEAASGRALIGHKVFLKAQKALFVTQEEAGEEVERRLVAAMRHYEIAQPCFGNILFRAFDASKGEKADSERIELVSLRDKVAIVNKEGISKFEMLINDFGPRIVILDPLNSMLAAGLNDNLVLTELILRLRTLHTPSPVAIIIMHHTRKGADLETQDASMGAAAIVNSSRTALNLQKLDSKEAVELGISPMVAAGVFRINHVKMNYTKPSEDEDIYQMIFCKSKQRHVGLPKRRQCRRRREVRPDERSTFTRRPPARSYGSPAYPQRSTERASGFERPGSQEPAQRPRPLARCAPGVRG